MPNGRFSRTQFVRPRAEEPLGEASEIIAKYLRGRASERARLQRKEPGLVQVTLPSGEVVLQPKKAGLVVQPFQPYEVTEEKPIEKPKDDLELLTAIFQRQGISPPEDLPKRIAVRRQDVEAGGLLGTGFEVVGKAATAQAIEPTPKDTTVARRKAFVKKIEKDLGVLYSEARGYLMGGESFPTELKEEMLSKEIDQLRLNIPGLRVFRSTEEWMASLPPTSDVAKMEPKQARETLEKAIRERFKKGETPGVIIHDKPRAKMSDFLRLLELMNE